MEFIELLALILCLTAVTCYLAAGALLLRKKTKPAAMLAAIGWLENLGIFIKNWYINGYPPFASMYQVLSDLSLVFLVIYLLIAIFEKDQRWVAPYFCFGAAIPLIGTLFMDKEMRWALVPALRSGWFVPHVFSYMLSYALAAVAFILTVAYLMKRDHPVRMKKAIYTIHRLSFPFMTIGLLFGALWADQVWGNYWQWDIKEIWSLVTGMLYLCYFHALRSSKLQKYAFVFSILGFAALIVTFLCVNLLPKIPGSLHTYA
ncbi:cytochrome c biogenesis protein [Ligaoa zhengdingensis]|uniref:cytochrome c biogenesis protein n=1 Tax=Ligaoa zhengdingensis TaxID=2763658 RepID=UPI0031B9D931